MFKPGKLPKNSTLTKEQLSTDFLLSLPYIVKHSLFLESDIIKRLRELGDVGNLIFITDVSFMFKLHTQDTKIKGNKAYERGDYYEALAIYEQVLAVFTWLEMNDPEMKDKAYTEYNFIGVKDADVELRQRRVINESDRDIETETSKKKNDV